MHMFMPSTYQVFLYYTKLICGCRRQKNAPKYPPPSPPSTDEDLLKFNNHPGLTWTRASVFDFWSLGLAAVETAETPLEDSDRS